MRGVWLRGAAVGVAALLGVSACGHSGAHRAAPAATVSLSASTAVSVSASASPSGALSPSPSPALPSRALLRSALLKTSELGPNFVAQSDSGGDTSGVTGCKALTSVLDGPGEPHQVQGQWQVAGVGPFAGETLTAGTAKAMRADYERVRSALADCGSLAFGAGKSALSLEVSPIRLGGKDSAAVRMDGMAQGVEVSGYLAVDQLGSVDLAFFYLELGNASSQVASALFSSAVAKAERVLHVPA